MSLTLRCYLVLAVIVCLGIVGQWSDPALRELWRYPAAALLLLLCYEGWRARRFAPGLKIISPPNVRLGRPLTAAIELQNHERYRLITLLQAADNEQLIQDRTPRRLATAAHDRRQITMTVVPQQLGAFCWSDIYSRSRGALGLAWWNRRFSFQQRVRVGPDHMPEREVRAGMTPYGRRQRLSPGHGMDYIGLREYTHGDPLNAIDWKATARAGKPISRVYTQEQRLEIFIMLDCGFSGRVQVGALTRVNNYINIAARLAQCATQSDDRVSVISYADEVLAALPPLGGANGLREVRAALSLVRALPRESNALAAVMHLRRRLQHRSLVVIFTDLESADSNRQLLKGMQLLRPKHLPLLVCVRDEDLEAMAGKPAANWLDPYEVYAAQEMIVHTEKLARQLRRLGCHLLHQKARHLDRAVLEYYGRLRGKV